MKTINIGGVPEHFNYPWSLAINKKVFQKHAIKATWKDYYGGTGQMSDALENGELDLAIMLTEGVLKKIDEGKDFIILQTYVASPLIWGVHVAANSKFQKLDDLENTTAAISRFGSGSHLLTYVNAKNQGWSTKNLDFEVVDNLEGAKKALPNNKAQYFMWERFTTKPLVDKGIFRRVAEVPTPWPCFVIATRKEFYQENPQQINALMEEINLITEKIKTVEKIEFQIAEKYKLEVKDVQEWLELTTWSQKQITAEEVEKTQNELLELGLIHQKTAYKDIVL